MKPRAYPKTDTDEQESVNLFRSLINTNRVKEDIRTRDKYPNTDGPVEIVDPEGVPLGKLEVQIKKIPKGAHRFSCPTSLYEYSKTTTLPLLLICCDVVNKVAYWRRIHATMPEYKDGQKSFTIRFDEETDTIDDNELYLQGWLEIVRDYQRCISDYSLFLKQLENKKYIDRIPAKEKEYFQRYIDRINSLLDHDFVAYKKSHLPDVWKLGVNICGRDQNTTKYQLYRIPYGATDPLIVASDTDPMIFNEYTESGHVCHTASMSDPEEAGENEVVDRVSRAIENGELSVHGVVNCTEIIFSFLDTKVKFLGAKVDQSEYSVDTISQFFYAYLSRLPKAPFIDEHCLHWPHLPLNLVGECIQYLKSNGIQIIQKTAQLFKSRPRNWSFDEEKEAVMFILDSACKEYRAFVEGNLLKFPESPYMNDQYAVIMKYKKRRPEWFHPRLEMYCVDNSSHDLPQIFTQYEEEGNFEGPTRDAPQVSIAGKLYLVKWHRVSSAPFLFNRMAQLSMTYRMLQDDFDLHYRHRPSIWNEPHWFH